MICTPLNTLCCGGRNRTFYLWIMGPKCNHYTSPRCAFGCLLRCPKGDNTKNFCKYKNKKSSFKFFAANISTNMVQPVNAATCCDDLAFQGYLAEHVSIERAMLAEPA